MTLADGMREIGEIPGADGLTRDLLRLWYLDGAMRAIDAIHADGPEAMLRLAEEARRLLAEIKARPEPRP